MTKRIFALLLALLMVIPIVACAADDTGKPAETTPNAGETTAAPVSTAPAVTEPEYKPSLPDVKYEGTELVIVHRAVDEQYYPEIYIQADEINGDLLNDSVYKRNTIIEERYGIDIVSVINSSPESAVSVSAQAQSDEYDIALPKMKNISSLITSGHLYNFHDLDYVDFSKPYWDSNFDKDITLYGKLYAQVSDISLMTMIGARGIIFNRDLAKENGLEDPYDLVHNNQWTLDKMIEMSLKVSADLDGDQAFTDLDQYGMLTEGSNFRMLVVACGIDIFTRDADGNPVVGFMNEKTISVIEKLRAIYKDETHAIDYTDLNGTAGAAAINSYWNYGRQIFANGQILFVQNGPSTLNQLVEFGMEEEYGMVPNPKYDTAQESYYHMPDYDTTVMVIPATNDDYDRLGVLLEDMAYTSNQTILPTYSETVIKVRRAPGPEIAEMIDIIKNSISYHLGLVYAVDATSIINQASTSGNISSVFKVGEKRMNALIKKVSDAVKELP